MKTVKFFQINFPQNFLKRCIHHSNNLWFSLIFFLLTYKFSEPTSERFLEYLEILTCLPDEGYKSAASIPSCTALIMLLREERFWKRSGWKSNYSVWFIKTVFFVPPQGKHTGMTDPIPFTKYLLFLFLFSFSFSFCFYVFNHVEVLFNNIYFHIFLT